MTEPMRGWRCRRSWSSGRRYDHSAGVPGAGGAGAPRGPAPHRAARRAYGAAGGSGRRSTRRCWRFSGRGRAGRGLRAAGRRIAGLRLAGDPAAGPAARRGTPPPLATRTAAARAWPGGRVWSSHSSRLPCRVRSCPCGRGVGAAIHWCQSAPRRAARRGRGQRRPAPRRSDEIAATQSGEPRNARPHRRARRAFRRRADGTGRPPLRPRPPRRRPAARSRGRDRRVEASRTWPASPSPANGGRRGGG